MSFSLSMRFPSSSRLHFYPSCSESDLLLGFTRHIQIKSRRAFHIHGAHLAKKPPSAILKPSTPPPKRKPNTGKPQSAVATSQQHGKKLRPTAPKSPTLDTISKPSSSSVSGSTPDKQMSADILPTQEYTSRPGTQMHLAEYTQPTTIYTLNPQRRFVMLSGLSTAFWISAANSMRVTYAVYDGPWASTISYAGLTAFVVYGALGAWCGLAPTKTISRIDVLPADPNSKQTLAGPTLRIESLKWLPFTKSQVFEISAKQAQLDQSISQAVAAIQASRLPLGDPRNVFHQQQHPDTGLMQRSSAWWRGLFLDFKKMFFRNSMARMRIENRGNWKLPLQDANMSRSGLAIDQLIKVDTAPVDWTKRLLR